MVGNGNGFFKLGVILVIALQLRTAALRLNGQEEEGQEARSPLLLRLRRSSGPDWAALLILDSLASPHS